jgi:hypothetical protein
MPGPPSMFDTPPVASPVPPALSNYIQPNLAHGLRIWWAFFWPTTLISMVLTIVVNYWARYFYENSNVPGRLLRPILRYDSYFFSYATAFFVMNYILRKNFRQFRIGLLSQRGEKGSEPLQPTLRRTIPVWWTYSWRTLVYGLIAMFVTAIPRVVLVGLFGWNRGLEIPDGNASERCPGRCYRTLRYLLEHPRREFRRFPRSPSPWPRGK